MANAYLTEIHIQWRIKDKSGGKDNDDEANNAAHSVPFFLNKFKGKC